MMMVVRHESPSSKGAPIRGGGVWVDLKVRYTVTVEHTSRHAAWLYRFDPIQSNRPAYKVAESRSLSVGVHTGSIVLTTLL